MSLVEFRKFENNLKFTLTVDLLVGVTNLVMSNGDIALLQALVPVGSHVICTFPDPSGVPIEVIELDRDLNILRAQEGTTDTLWSSGQEFEVRLTADTLTQLIAFISNMPTTLQDSINTILVDDNGNILTDGINVLTL